MLFDLRCCDSPQDIMACDDPDETRRRYLVRRSHFMTIVSAWIVTLPVSAVLSALVFLALNALFT